MLICKKCGTKAESNIYQKGYYCSRCKNIKYDEVYSIKDIYKMLKEWEEFRKQPKKG